MFCVVNGVWRFYYLCLYWLFCGYVFVDLLVYLRLVGSIIAVVLLFVLSFTFVDLLFCGGSSGELV